MPITIIWGAEHDSEAKNTVATALVGATEKTLQNDQNLKKWKIEFFFDTDVAKGA